MDVDIRRGSWYRVGAFAQAGVYSVQSGERAKGGRLAGSVVTFFLPIFPILKNSFEHFFARRVQPFRFLLLEMVQD